MAVAYDDIDPTIQFDMFEWMVGRGASCTDAANFDQSRNDR